MAVTPISKLDGFTAVVARHLGQARGPRAVLEESNRAIAHQPVPATRVQAPKVGRRAGIGLPVGMEKTWRGATWMKERFAIGIGHHREEVGNVPHAVQIL